jgi:hypothetical protein
LRLFGIQERKQQSTESQLVVVRELFFNTQLLIYTESKTHKGETMSNLTKLIVDCSTGITTEVELTAEEIAQREKDIASIAAQRAEQEAAEAAKAEAKASANAKLAALGLTAEEIAAL